ncbi:MAG: hypothetical protein JWR59_1684 [Brevundimonas sp.]|nr:hypothetical protein [Brevundimonas sp.]
MQIAASLSTSVLEMLRDAGAVQAAERGQVHVISVDAIREAVGARWGRQQDLIEDFVIRSFRRGAREDDFIVRVNEADFILIQPGRPAISALSRASQLMRETLSYFLGEVKAENLRISIVDRLQGESIEASAVPADHLKNSAAERTRSLTDAGDGSPPWERFGVASANRKTVLVERPDAASLRAILYLEPVWNLRQGAVAAFRIRSVVLHEAANGGFVPTASHDLTPRCELALTQRRLAFAEEVWTSCPGAPPALHLPVSFGGLTHSSARTGLVSYLTRLRARDPQRLLVLELSDWPLGLPAPSLATLVTQMKPFVRGLLAYTDKPADIVRWRQSGLCGVVWRTPDDSPADTRQLAGFAEAARCARMAAGFSEVHSHSQFMQAWAQGFSHLSGELISRTFGDPLVPQRFDAHDLYARKGRGVLGDHAV